MAEMATALSEVAEAPRLVKGVYLVRGSSLYYILGTRPKEGMLLVENCWTGNVQWEETDIVRSSVKEVIGL